MGIHINALIDLNIAYRTVETMERGISKVLTEHLGIPTDVVRRAGDGTCIYFDDGNVAPLTYELFDKIMSMPPAEAIQYIKDRSI